MSRYIRPRRHGATIFFTVALATRGSQLLVTEVEPLRQTVRDTRAERPFRSRHGWCCRTICTASGGCPRGDTDYATRWRLIKARFSRGVGAGPRRASHVVRGERAVWQRRFWGEARPEIVPVARFQRRTGEAPAAKPITSGMKGFRGASALLLVQSGETRAGGAGAGLAVLLGSPRDRSAAMGMGDGRPVGVVVHAEHAPYS